MTSVAGTIAAGDTLGEGVGVAATVAEGAAATVELGDALALALCVGEVEGVNAAARIVASSVSGTFFGGKH